MKPLIAMLFLARVEEEVAQWNEEIAQYCNETISLK
jgi:hypothetical protein